MKIKSTRELAQNILFEENNELDTCMPMHSMTVGLSCRFAKKINFIHFSVQCTTKIELRKSFFSQ